MRQFELDAAVLLTKYNVSRLLDRLEAEKLLVRYACETDGRGALVQIMPKGHELLKRMWSVYGVAINEYFAGHFNDVKKVLVGLRINIFGQRLIPLFFIRKRI